MAAPLKEWLLGSVESDRPDRDPTVQVDDELQEALR